MKMKHHKKTMKSRGTVILFAKAPRAGRVKTRLGAGVGMGRAAALFRILTKRTLDESSKGPWETIVAVDPPGALHENLWPSDVARMPQACGDLGARMADAFRSAPLGPVVIIGADAPALRTRHLRQALHALGGADAVFGPAKDGGYWLIGLARRRAAPALFNNVRWSTKHALNDTLASLPPGFQVRMLECLSDIDTADDLTAFGPHATAR